MPALQAPKPKERKKRKLPKIISGDEAARLLEAADEGGPVGARNQAILTLLYRAGLRVSEVTAIKMRDIDADGVIRLYDAKGGDGTAYFDSEAVWPVIERWLAHRASWGCDVPGIPLFCKPDGKPVTVRYIQRLVKRLKAELGIAGVLTPHVLRHTFATEMVEEGFSLPEIQRAVRHANLATTAIYLHVRDESLRKKISQRGRKEENASHE